MKKNILIKIICILFVSTNYAQETNKIESKYFVPIKIHLNTGDIITGYGSLYNSRMNSVKFTKDIGTSEYMKDWVYYSSKEVLKMELDYPNQKQVFYTLKMKGKHGFVTLEHENDSISLYSHLAVYGKIFVIKKSNEIKTHLIWLNPKKKDKSIHKKYAKLFSNCNSLKQKIISGEFKNTYTDLVSLLNYYDNCKKN
jgi:hypothetical protein